ncbi:MAG: arginine repressor [Lachnospiraceae bacterium]|nr:arginine repressor [Lachnospiraceae bacterium]
MKKERQNAIIQIITNNNVETQEDLQALLKEKGFDVTQATISRDMRELKVTKISYDGNKHKYSANPVIDSGTKASYKHVLGNCVLSIDHAQNIIVIKTVSGMAMAVGAAIDHMDISGIMGCIAGDDTIFLAIRDSKMAEDIIGDIKKCY